MDDIESLLIFLYKCYKNSSEKWHESQELYQSLKGEFSFQNNALRPAKSYDTRWISHRLQAMQVIFDKFSIFEIHLENVIADLSKYTGKATLEGHRRKLVEGKMLLHLALFLDILAPVRKLSLALQSKVNTTAVEISGFIEQCMETYQSMYDHLKDSPYSIFQLKHLAKIKENLIEYAYQGVKLSRVQSAMNALPRQAQSYIENILKALRERFDDEDSILKYACQILDMNTWHFSDDDAPVRDMLEKHFIAINNIFQQFKDPLI